MLYGNELNSSALASSLKGNYLICDPETIGRTADSWGAVSVAPPVQAVVDTDYNQIDRYHAWFAAFLETNHSVLAKCGADDLRIFMEIFYAQGQQCNVEVFDREVISTIGRFNVALPLSIYALHEAALTEWAMQIEQDWRGFGAAQLTPAV